MQYWWWLAGLSVLFVALERLHPARRAQPWLRRGLLTDLAWLVLNGHFLGVWIALASRPLVERFIVWLDALGLRDTLFADAASSWHWAAQLVVAFVVLDFIQWCVHVTLHRVPALWAFHRVHHSVREMDWIANFRFHFAEPVLYKAAMYLPLVYFGFRGDVLFAIAVFGTAWGFFNHANIDVRLGLLEKVFNSPRMHLWHHHDEPGRGPCNYGIVLSVWDWIFGTAWLPERPPTRLGFDDVEHYPVSLPGALLRPLGDLFRRRR